MKRNKYLSACAIVALAGTSAGAQVIDWAAAADGNWNLAGNWVGANIPNAVGEDAVLGLAAAYTVGVTNSFSIGSLTLSNPLATLELGNNQTLTLNGGLNNDGIVTINFPAEVFNTHLSFGADATISGSGAILLNAQSEPNDAQILANAFTLTHSAGHLIHGSGNLAGNMFNSGNIIADDPAGAGLRLSGTLTQSAGGNAGADAGTMLLGNGSVTTGGELISVNGGKISVQTSATIGDIINSGDIEVPGQGWSLHMNADVQNNGTITLNSDNAVFNAHLWFDGATTLSGTGKVLMQSNGSLDDAHILTSGLFDGTIGANQTAEGSGLITGASGGTIVNLGTINGNDPAVSLGLAGNHSGVGGGMYRSDGGKLDLRSGLILDGGTFDSSAGGVAEVSGNGTATLSNVANNGEMGVRGQSGSITLAGPMTNNGTLTLNNDGAVFNAHLRFGATTSLTGSGTVQMVVTGGLDDAQVFTDGLFSGTIGAGQTVQGSGMVDGRSGGTIINNGIINGNHAAAGKAPAVELRLQGNHDGSGGGVYRSDDGILGLGNGLVLDGGTFDSSGVGIVEMTTSGTSTLSNVANLGEMGVRGQGGLITLVGPMTNDGNITLNTDGAIFNAHIRFGTDTAINGSGSVTMVSAGNSGDAQFFTDGAFLGTIGAGQTVQGSGQVDGRSGGTIINNGTINGNDSVFALELRGGHTGSGVYRSDDGVLALINGASLDGGTFDSSGTGIVEMTSNGIVTLSNITNSGEMGVRGQGGIIELPTNLTNNGNITLNTDGTIFNAHIRFISDSALNGMGTINMATAGSIGDAQIIADTGFVGTIGAGQSLSGDGLLVGELNMDGSMDPGGILRRFDIDTMHMSASSAMTADLGGLLGGEFDRLLLGGADSIDLDGSLTVNLDDGYSPEFGDSWDIISGGSISGEFASEIVPEPAIGMVYRVIYEPSRVFVVLTCAADLTGDNILDFFDISLFLSYFTSDDVRSDINGDGAFDFFDISLFLQIFSGDCL